MRAGAFHVGGDAGDSHLPRRVGFNIIIIVALTYTCGIRASFGVSGVAIVGLRPMRILTPAGTDG